MSNEKPTEYEDYGAAIRELFKRVETLESEVSFLKGMTTPIKAGSPYDCSRKRIKK